MIRADELMVWDWVQVEDACAGYKIPCKVTYVQDKRIGLLGDLFVNSLEIECIQPIPLTPEILEKNGFVCCQYCHEWKNGEAIVQIAFPNCRMKNGEKEFSTDKMQYIHELQHAIRLCGIEKDITI